MTKQVVVGRFGRVHGVRGDIHVISFTEPSTNILDYSPWLIEKAGQWQPIAIASTRLHNQDIIAHIKNCDDRELAKRYTNIDIAVPIEALPKLAEQEYYWSELIGLRVIDKDGKDLGEVTEILETGANDVLVVKGETEHLIPYTKDVVLNIDINANQIKVDWEPLD
jgi:16S rRNA processing protein RimM